MVVESHPADMCKVEEDQVLEYEPEYSYLRISAIRQLLFYYGQSILIRMLPYKKGVSASGHSRYV